MMSDLRIERRGDGVLLLTLNRPNVMNAIDVRLLDDLYQALFDGERDASVRVIVITGAGDRAFCSGGDIKSAHDARTQGANLIERAYHHQGVVSALEWLATPIITAVNGLAYALGLAIVLSSDLCIASDNASFGVPEARRGFFDPYMPSRLAVRIGAERARYMMMTAEAIAADVAERWGLVSRVVPAAILEEEAMKVARTVALSSPRVLRDYKYALRRTYPEFDVGSYMIGATLAESHDGLAAFTDKSAPPVPRLEG